MAVGIKMGTLFKDTKGLMRYIVRFLSNDGSGSMPEQKYYVGKEYTLPGNTFTKTGYNFGGWSADCEDGKRTLADQAVIKNLAKKNGFIVKLTAIWNGIRYYISYNKNFYDPADHQNMLNSQHTYGTTSNTRLNTYTRVGYTFQGWASSELGPAIYSNGYPVSTMTHIENKIIPFYAKWLPITYTVLYSGNNAKEGHTDSSEHTYDSAKSLSINGFVRSGYSFAGWSGQDGRSYSNGQTVLNLRNSPGTFTMIAQWVRNTITYLDDNDDSAKRISETPLKVDCTDFHYMKFKVRGNVEKCWAPGEDNWVTVDCGFRNIKSQFIMKGGNTGDPDTTHLHGEESPIYPWYQWLEITWDISFITGVQDFSAWVTYTPGGENWWVEAKNVVLYN